MRPPLHAAAVHWLIALLCLIAAAPRASAQQPATAIPVGTAAAELRPITQATEFVGRVEAVERVEIRARVTGFLQEVLFKEGDIVKAGDVLYRIEPDTFQAAVQQAQGALYRGAGQVRQRHRAARAHAGTDQDRRRLEGAARRTDRR